MSNFWDFSVWGPINLIAVLLLSLLAANLLKKYIPGLEQSLIPSSVLGGGILLLISSVYTIFTDKACTIHRKYNMLFQHANILQDHIVSTLQKGRIDCNNRNHTLLCKTASH